jgi:predicted DNA-binding transcriptional regulator AlpA
VVPPAADLPVETAVRGRLMIPDPRDRPVISAEEAFAELGIEKHTGYQAIRDGTFPVPVIRIGRLIRVPTAALRQVLLLDSAAPVSSKPEPER